MRLYGVSDVATLMAGGFNQTVSDEDQEAARPEADQFARTIRHLVSKGAIVPTTLGPQRSALFDTLGILRAAVLIHLDRVGISHDVLAHVASRRMHRCAGWEVGEADDCLRHIVPHVRGGKRAFYQLFFSPAYYGRQADVRDGYFTVRDDDLGHDFDSAVVTVPLLSLFQPLLRAIDASEG